MNNVWACVINGTGSTSALDAERGCVRPQSGYDVKQDTHLAPENYRKRKVGGNWRQGYEVDVRSGGEILGRGCKHDLRNVKI